MTCSPRASGVWPRGCRREFELSKKHIQPPELFESRRFGFTQVVESPPGRLLFVSGQGAFDAEFNLVGGSDLTAQAEQSLENLGHALRAAGATPSDVTSLRIYVVDYAPEYAALIGPTLLAFFKGAPPSAQTLIGVQALAIGTPLRNFFGDAAPPAQTLIGVQALGLPGMLIEIEATAVAAS